MSHKNIPLILVILLLFTVIMQIPAAMAQDSSNKAPVGTVMEVENIAHITREGVSETEEMKVNTEIYLNDVIETGEASRALILLIDDTEITLGAYARLTIDEYIFDVKAASENKGRFSVLRGTFLFVSGLITKTRKPDVEIETAYGSIGIRGTTLWGGMIDGEYSVLVHDGKVTFSTDTGSTNIGKGFATSVKNRNSRPSRPKRWSDKKTSMAAQKVALRDSNQVKKRIKKRKQNHKEMRKHYKEAMKKPVESRSENPEQDMESRSGSSEQDMEGSSGSSEQDMESRSENLEQGMRSSSGSSGQDMKSRSGSSGQGMESSSGSSGQGIGSSSGSSEQGMGSISDDWGTIKDNRSDMRGRILEDRKQGSMKPSRPR